MKQLRTVPKIEIPTISFYFITDFIALDQVTHFVSFNFTRNVSFIVTLATIITLTALCLQIKTN